MPKRFTYLFVYTAADLNGGVKVGNSSLTIDGPNPPTTEGIREVESLLKKKIDSSNVVVTAFHLLSPSKE